MMEFLGGMYKIGGERGMMMNDGSFGGGLGLGSVMGLLTWIAVVAVLFALARLLWKKGDKVK